MSAGLLPPAQYVENFLFQSYFDSAKLEKAILASPPNAVITPSTERTVDVQGYGVALDPASETPVAITLVSSWGGVAGTLILKPGQTIKPGFAFNGLRWGLPKGWLGGGLAILNVLRAPSADLYYVGETKPVIFHRTRLVIEADGAVLPTLRRNWPSRFPWTQAIRDAAVTQKSGPIGSIRQSQVLLRLRSNDAASARSLRFVFRGAFNFDAAADGTVGATDLDSVWRDVTFPLNPGAAPTYSVVTLPAEALPINCDEGGVTVLNVSGDATLTGKYIDVVRYGTIG